MRDYGRVVAAGDTVAKKTKRIAVRPPTSNIPRSDGDQTDTTHGHDQAVEFDREASACNDASCVAGLPVVAEVRHDQSAKHLGNRDHQNGNDPTAVVMSYKIQRLCGTEPREMNDHVAVYNREKMGQYVCHPEEERELQ